MSSTGRENIYVNGAILGLTKQQIDGRLEEIIDFAEVDDFIDTPVKFYSSGMFVRLGFAVAVHADPDVLIVDEVLAVGDLAFQVKCYDRMNQIRDRGTTVVMVSHHLGLVRRMCERVLLIHNGSPQHLGLPEDSIAAFHEILSAESEIHVDDSGLRHEPQVVEIQSVALLGPNGIPTGHLDAGQPATLRVRARALQTVDDLVVASTLFAGMAPPSTPTPRRAIPSVRSRPAATSAGPWPSDRNCRPGATKSACVSTDPTSVRRSPSHPPVSFFVTGRNSVSGLADLEAAFTREDEDLCEVEAIGLGREAATDVAL